MLASEAVDLAEQPIDFLGFGVDDVDKFGVFCLEVIHDGVCTCLQGLYLILVEFLQLLSLLKVRPPVELFDGVYLML